MTTENSTPRDDEQTPADENEATSASASESTSEETTADSTLGAAAPPAIPREDDEPAPLVEPASDADRSASDTSAQTSVLPEQTTDSARDHVSDARTERFDPPPAPAGGSDVDPSRDDTPTTVAPAAAAGAGAGAAAASTSPPAQPQVVYVSAPTPPRKKGARGVGAAVVLLSTGIFAVLYAAVTLVLALTLRADGINGITDYLATPPFWLPVVVFGLAHLLLVILVNRAGWWAHVLGGFLVAVVVWLGFIGAALIASGTIGGTAADQQAVFLQQLVNPLGVAAAVLAREIPIWVGGIVARRGRTVTTRNAEARERYESEMAEHRASTTPQGTAATR